MSKLEQTSKGAALIELESIHKSFSYNSNLIEVLKGVDLMVRPGETLAVMGASGVGKSTLLHIMGTLDPPTKGQVRFDGRNVWEMDEQVLCRLRNRRIGFVFQFHHLLPELNALENVTMPLLIGRANKRRALERAAELLVKVGLEKRFRHRVGELSGGEQQRVAIARALAAGPALLLADEPTGNLDKNTGEGVIELLLRLNREQGLAMVIATHNREFAQKLSRQMEIVDGRLQNQ